MPTDPTKPVTAMTWGEFVQCSFGIDDGAGNALSGVSVFEWDEASNTWRFVEHRAA